MCPQKIDCFGLTFGRWQTTTTASTTSKTTLATSTTSKAATATTTTTGATVTGAYDCTVTAYAGISAAVKSCTNILLSGVSAPASSTMSLALQTGASLTFAGKTTFGTTLDADFDPIVLTGTDITVAGAAGHVIDGNGQNYCMFSFLLRPGFFSFLLFSLPADEMGAPNPSTGQGTARAPTAAGPSRTTSSWSRACRTR